MPISTYRFRTDVTVKAIRWIGEDNCAEVFAFLDWDHSNDETSHFEINGIGDDETAYPGNWIVLTPDGEHHVVTDEQFNETFEPDAPAKFTWPESIGSSGDTVLIPVKADGRRAGDLHLDLAAARLLQAALAGLITDLEFARRVAPNSPSWTGAGHE